MPYYGDALPYYYGGPFSNHSSLMTGTGRTIHSPLGSSRYAPHLSTISESPLSALRRYSPAASATTTAMSSRPKRVIDTADIDVSTPRALSRPDGGGGHRNRLRRDRPTIRIRSQALKDNPALREHYERHEKTVGELLVEKFLIKDKKPDGGVGDAQDAVVRPKLYTQVSLERAAAAAAAAATASTTTTTTTDDTNNNHDRDELHEAMQKRVTRRMTRRRSSADVQMDPEQLEREVLIALAQADALDELVAEEQAEIEVETRMGTLIRKNLVRAAPSVLGKHESQSGGVEDDDETRTARKLAKKVKKRRKTTDKPSPPSESEWESEADARKPRTARDKVSGSVGQDGGGSVGQDGGGSNGQDGVRSIDVSQDGGGEQNDDSPGTTGKALKFKVEASNSVGDFSTLWINAGAAEERENQRKASQAIVEQFRDSVRLPAPKAAARLARPDRNKDVIVEEHQQVVVLPVRKRYVKDDSRNSVYLTLKTPKNGVAAASAERPDDSVGNCGDGSPGGADYERLTSLSNGSQSRAEKVAKFRSKDIAESDAEVGSISESSAGRVEGPGERWTKDGALDDDEPDEKSISSSGIRDEASGILDDRDPRRRAAADDVDASTIARPTSDESSRDLGKFRKAASGKKLTERARDVGIVESPARNKDPRSPIGTRKDEVSGKNIGITAEQKRTKIGVGALDSASAKVENRFARNASDGRAKTGETNADHIEGVSSVAATRIVDESLPNASTIKSLDARVELGQLLQDQAVKIRGGESDGFSHEGEKLGATGNSEASNEDQPGFPWILAKNCEVETPKYKSKLAIQADESPKTPGRNGHFFKFDEDSTEVDGKDAADASRVRNGREVLGKFSSLGGNDVDEVRTEYPDLKVVPDSPRKVGFQLKKRAIATANGEKSAPQSPVEKSDSAIDPKKKLKREKDTEKTAENLVEKKIPESPKSNGLKSPLQSPVEKSDSAIDTTKKLKREKDTENLVEKKIPESPKSNGLKSPLQSPVEKSDSSIDAKRKLKCEKDTENLVEKKLPESPKSNGLKSPLQSPVEKSDSSIDAKRKLKCEKDTENLVEKKLPESPKSNGLKSPLQSPVEKLDSSIDAKKKLKREKDTEKIVENLVEKKIPESPKSNGLKSPLQSPVEKSDSSIDAKTKLKREKDTETTAENLVEKKLPESPKSNGLRSPLQSPVEKSDSSINAKTKLKREKDTEKTAENLIDKKLPESAKTGDESAKLTNGVSKLKLRPIEEIRENRELAKAEKPKLRIWNKPDTPPIQEDDGIDFWGEIASQRVAKPAARARIEPTEIAEVPKILVAERNAINSEPEVKPNPPTESGTPVVQKESESLATEERKPGKARKKKTTESGACKKKDQEKASAETISERVISVEGGDEETPRQQPSGKSSESETSEEKSRGSHEADRFERNLSTIAEEGSPVSEELPRIRDLASSIPSTREKSSDTRPEPSRVLVPEKPVKTASTVASDLVEPEATSPVTDGKIVVATAAEISGNSVEPEAASSSPSSPFTESSVPTINIVEAPSTPPDQEPPELREDQPEEATQEDEQEGPGTPTNEAADETPNNITKWTGRSDLSLDEPDKDVVPEAAPGTKKDSAKKKTSTKKKVSKKGSKSSSNSVNTPGASPDSSKTKKLAKRKKSSTKTGKESDKRSIFERESKISVSSDTTLKPGGLNLRNSPKNSPRNTPKQRPLDLIKMFYTTPASLLTATPRDLSKVRRAKIKKKKHSTRTASASSDSTGSTRSTQSTGTAESTGSTEHEDDAEQKRISSTRSNDSGFDGSPRLSNCDMACHKKCEKLTGNLCGLNQKLVAEALQALKRVPVTERRRRIRSGGGGGGGGGGSEGGGGGDGGDARALDDLGIAEEFQLSAPSQSSDNQRNSDGSDHHHASGRITPPATNLPRFKKYTVMDFNFLKVLGKGSFGKVLLAELRRTDCVYAVKCLKKDVVLEDDDVECTLIERKVLTLATRHPYLCHLFCTFQTDSHLFFVMEYLNGGDLMFHIQKSGRFAESRARFYAAEIWSGLNFLHKKGIVYRDLKLDNVLLDFEGHIRIADFGMCKLQIFLDRTADTFCGTPDYMAPEIIKGLKYNQAVDWWSFGVLLYEMLTGQSPFSGCDEDELFWSICNERPFIPRYLSQEAMDVLVCLLEKDAGKRPLAHDISVHPFFHSTQWDRLERRQLEPPFKPALEHTLDTRYFDTAFTAERPRLTPVPEQILTSMDQGVFRGFSYTNPNATD